MKKTINIIVTKPHSILGPINTHKKVSLGYAFNYLIPQQFVEIATKGKLKHIKMLNNIKLKKDNQNYIHNLTIKRYLEQITKIKIRKKIGQNKQIFGSITENDIIEKIIQITGHLIEKKQIIMPNIKEIGIYNISIKIEDNIYSDIEIQILPNII
uniref:Large ribosomal subunit protein bL9c n=1 Tax=Calliarthron tuberculosum TaxID=48942 RepID=M4IV60_CALTB|nr:50S ribosomal protein L9 [Calliarthron tuberculosum]AGA63797.1 50S ribosomal protein L9 [Calliarthron tuberculosum]